jgi:hypothetical protein
MNTPEQSVLTKGECGLDRLDQSPLDQADLVFSDEDRSCARASTTRSLSARAAGVASNGDDGEEIEWPR